MLADDTDKDTGLSNSSYAVMHRIAATLQCSVEDFMDGTGDKFDVKGSSELLSIWAELESEESRDKLLNFARNLAVLR